MAGALAFLSVVVLIVPGAIYVGRLSQRVKTLEDRLVEILAELHAIRERLPGSSP